MHARARRLPGVVLLSVAMSLLAPVVALAGTWPTNVPKLEVAAERIAGRDRFETAVAMALRAYPGWAGVSDVVIANGDDASLVDPLSAASLCWAYDAPLLLVSKYQTPSATVAALRAIASANTTVTVHVVGGRAVVPTVRLAQLRNAIGGGTVEQPWPAGGRYVTAAGIATRVRDVAAADGRAIPAAVFVANGADPARFTDALTASAVSRAKGIPILLTSSTSAPSETLSALSTFGNAEVVLVGGTRAISASVYRQLEGDARWAGANRYLTGATVARKAVGRGWSTGSEVGLASSLADALTGGASLGRSGGVVLPTDAVRLPADVFNFLLSPPATIARCFVFGGPKVVADAELLELRGYPGRPRITSPSGKYVGKTVAVSGAVNANTTSVALYIGGAYVGSKSVTPYGAFTFSAVTSPARSGVIEIRAQNPDGKTCSEKRTVERLIYPYATCIVVDKSDFRLYWVKNNRLVASYPIALGRLGMETPSATWKVLAKYQTDPWSVYGPRKMRLFRKVGSSFVYTAYGIHGTNQPWVIGTRASHGCIRLYNADILKLYPLVTLGTWVVTRN